MTWNNSVISDNLLANQSIYSHWWHWFWKPVKCIWWTFPQYMQKYSEFDTNSMKSHSHICIQQLCNCIDVQCTQLIVIGEWLWHPEIRILNALMDATTTTKTPSINWINFGIVEKKWHNLIAITLFRWTYIKFIALKYNESARNSIFKSVCVFSLNLWSLAFLFPLFQFFFLIFFSVIVGCS